METAINCIIHPFFWGNPFVCRGTLRLVMPTLVRRQIDRTSLENSLVILQTGMMACGGFLNWANLAIFHVFFHGLQLRWMSWGAAYFWKAPCGPWCSQNPRVEQKSSRDLMEVSWVIGGPRFLSSIYRLGFSMAKTIQHFYGVPPPFIWKRPNEPWFPSEIVADD